MRTILIAGSTAIILALGASSVYANGPDASPYEVLVPQPAAQPEAAPTPAPEGRAAYTGAAYAPQDNNFLNTYGVPGGDAGRSHAR